MQYNNIRMSTDASCIVLNTRSRYNSFHPKPCVNMFYRMMSLLSSCNQWLVLKCLEMHCYYLFNGFWKKKRKRDLVQSWQSCLGFSLSFIPFQQFSRSWCQLVIWEPRVLVNVTDTNIYIYFLYIFFVACVLASFPVQFTRCSQYKQNVLFSD